MAGSARLIRNLIYILVVLSMLTELPAYGWSLKDLQSKIRGGREEKIVDTSGEIIDTSRAFEEKVDAKMHQDSLLFKIRDENGVIFICRMDSDGKNLKKILQYKVNYRKEDSPYVASHHPKGDNYVQRNNYSDYYWTKDGKMIILIGDVEGYNDRDSRWIYNEYPREFYMADWEGTNLEKIGRNRYYFLKENYGIK